MINAVIDITDALSFLEGMHPASLRVISNVVGRATKGIYSGAFANLSGGGALSRKKYGWLYKGRYPVPVVTGHLRRALYFVLPGRSKGDFSAGPLEGVVYNAASYGWAIHEGRGSMSGRPYLSDAAQNVLGSLDTFASQELDKEFR